MPRSSISLLCILLSLGALFGTELNVAVVDEQVLLDSYLKSQDFVQSLKDQFKKEESSLKALNDKIIEMEKSLEKQLRILGPEKAKELYEDFTKSKIELEIREKALRETHVFSKNQYTMQVIQDINDALEVIGAEKKYDLILRKYIPSPNSGEAQRNVFFNSERMDITKDVLEFMNAKYRQSQK